jgi:predicted acyltransferase
MSGSLLFAIAMVLLWWLAMYGFYRRGWFLKV